MSGINSVILAGNISSDLRVSKLPSGTKVTFNLAVAHDYNKGNERVKETYFIPIILWGQQAELAAKYLSKGRGIIVDGWLQTRDAEKESIKYKEMTVRGRQWRYPPSPGNGNKTKEQNGNEESCDGGDDDLSGLDNDTSSQSSQSKPDVKPAPVAKPSATPKKNEDEIDLDLDDLDDLGLDEEETSSPKNETPKPKAPPVEDDFDIDVDDL